MDDGHYKCTNIVDCRCAIGRDGIFDMQLIGKGAQNAFSRFSAHHKPSEVALAKVQNPLMAGWRIFMRYFLSEKSPHPS